jgi:hypothetical protein
LKKILLLISLMTSCLGAFASSNLVVLDCETTHNVREGNNEVMMEMIIDFNLTNKTCNNGFGKITAVSEKEIYCDTSKVIVNLEGYRLNRYTGELYMIFKKGNASPPIYHFKCKKVNKII